MDTMQLYASNLYDDNEELEFRMNGKPEKKEQTGNNNNKRQKITTAKCCPR